jgi:hypothetical protein
MRWRPDWLQAGTTIEALVVAMAAGMLPLLPPFLCVA